MKMILLGEPPAAPTYTAAVIRATEVEPLPPEQRPRPFCAVLTKGMQTRWYNSTHEINEAHYALAAQGAPHLMFRYEPALGRYMAHDPYS